MGGKDTAITVRRNPHPGAGARNELGVVAGRPATVSRPLRTITKPGCEPSGAGIGR